MKIKTFRDLDELLRVFQSEHKLIRQLFLFKDGTITYSDALSQVEYNNERFNYLISKGVIRSDGDTVELEDVYLTFFEEILLANEEISIQDVKECVDSFLDPIRNYMDSTSQIRRNEYVSKARRAIRSISQRTMQNAIKLKRNVENTYKHIPEYAIKKRNLQKLKEQKRSIDELIRAVEKEISNQTIFFETANDSYLSAVVRDSRETFTEVNHFLVDIEKQIIEYLNQIEYQNRLFRKLRRVCYLIDKHTIRQASNIEDIVSRSSGVWIEPRKHRSLQLSIEQLRATDLTSFLLQLSKDVSSHRKRRKSNVLLFDDDIQNHVEKVNLIDPDVVFNTFKSSGKDLFQVVMKYDFHFPVSEEDRILLYCQLATQYIDYLDVTTTTNDYKGYEFPAVTPNPIYIKRLEQSPI